MRVDAHVHFWRYAPQDYPWIGADMAVLAADHLPADLEPELRRRGFAGAVAVQATHTVQETRWLLDLAARHGWVLGVVGWVDLCDPWLERTLAGWCREPRFVGVRHLVQDEADPGFLGRSDVRRGIATLARFDLSFDLLVRPHLLPAAAALARALPRQRFVLDHIAKPPIRTGALGPWRDGIRELARCGNVWCKLSGLVTEAAWRTWQAGQMRACAEVVLEAFGPGRILFGSDWPVCRLAAAHGTVVDLAEDLLAGLTPAERAAAFGGTALQVYRLAR